MNKEPIYIWTDGSCNRTNKLGGIGIYIKYKKYEKKLKIGYKSTKIGRMEIKAVIVALRQIKNKSKNIIIYSDSQYVVKSITLWMQKWILSGWIGIKNVDMWKQFLIEYNKFDKYKIKFIHVKGHTGKCSWRSLGNEIADSLAAYKEQEFYNENDMVL